MDKNAENAFLNDVSPKNSENEGSSILPGSALFKKLYGNFVPEKSGLSKRGVVPCSEIMKDFGKMLQEKIPDDIALRTDFLKVWEDVAPHNVRKYSQAVELTKDGVLRVFCENSAAAFELNSKKSQINQKLSAEAEAVGLEYMTFRVVYHK